MENFHYFSIANEFGNMVSYEDSVRIYALCAKCQGVVKVLGRGDVTKDEDVFIL